MVRVASQITGEKVTGSILALGTIGNPPRKSNIGVGYQWLTPVIIATWKAHSE
jgi:hypothetical protein